MQYCGVVQFVEGLAGQGLDLCTSETWRWVFCEEAEGGGVAEEK